MLKWEIINTSHPSTHMVNEVDAGFDGKHHTLDKVPRGPQTAQTRLIDALCAL